MTVVTTKTSKCYIADSGKKVKFKNTNRLYEEIVVGLEDSREVEEVEVE